MNLLDIARGVLPPAAEKRVATAEEARELRHLVNLLSGGWPAEERAEALAVALADPDDALVAFRALAADLLEAQPAMSRAPPLMPTCGDCGQLARDGRCLAAVQGKTFGAGSVLSANYKPTADWPLRCAQFVPKPGYPDQRPGAERWPWLLDEHYFTKRIAAHEALKRSTREQDDGI